MQTRENVPVVVVGGSLNSLGVIRSLSWEGMPIFVMDTTLLCPCGWSRHCQFIKIEQMEGRPLIDALKSASKAMGTKAVLLITDDRAVETISTYRNEVFPLFYTLLPSKRTVQCLTDKGLFQEFSEHMGLPVPRSEIIASEDDLPRLARLTFPVVIKPVNKALVLNGQVSRVERAYSHSEAHTISKGMVHAAGGVIVQEWIEGADSDIYFSLFMCDSNSNVTALFSGRKLICDPPGVGNTALCVAAGEPDSKVVKDLETMTRKFISLVNYKGLGSLESKRDVRTGNFVIIEPTVGRTDWQEEIATFCGVNIPLIAYYTILERDISTPPLLNGRRIAWRSSVDHKPHPQTLLAGTEIREGYFRFRDPLPGFYYYGYERFAAPVWRMVKRSILN